MEDKQNLLELLEKIKISPSIPVVEELSRIRVALEALVSKEEPKEERPEVQKVELEGINVVTLKGDKGDTPKVGIDFEQPRNGEDYVLTEEDKKEIASAIVVPVVEKIIEKTEVLQPIVTNEVKEVAVADTPEQLVEKLESLEGKDRLNKSAIEGLEEMEKELRDAITSNPSGKWIGVPIGDRLKVQDLTALTDGSNKTFELEAYPRNENVVKLWSSDFPHVLYLNRGFTISGKILTLSAEVDAPSQGAILVCEYTI